MNPNTRQAQSRGINLLECGSKLTISALLCVGLGSCSPLVEAVPVTWDFRFQCEPDADRTETVELRVAKGGCPITEPVAFETLTSTWEEPGSRPQGLPAGLYAFAGTAWDENGKPIASACESVKIPTRQTIVLNMLGTSTCGGTDEEREDGGPRDSGARDSGTRMDAGGPADAGSMPDVAVIDECPSDPAKTTKGQCGCGNPDVDQDGDGTAACVDKCDTDANKLQPGTCGCNPKTKLLMNESLVAGEYLCGPIDDRVRFALEEESVTPPPENLKIGRLHIRVDGVDTWVSDGQMGARVWMQGSDGNLVLRVKSSGSSSSAWASGTTPNAGAILEVHGDRTVTIALPATMALPAGKVLWKDGKQVP